MTIGQVYDKSRNSTAYISKLIKAGKNILKIKIKMNNGGPLKKVNLRQCISLDSMDLFCRRDCC